MIRIDRLNGQNYADNIIDPLLANDEQSGWSVTSGSGVVTMSTTAVFQGKKSLKVQNNTPTVNLVVSNSIQSSVIDGGGAYGFSMFLLKQEVSQALSGEVVIYQNASPYSTQTFILDTDSETNDLNDVWVRFECDEPLNFTKGDIITFTIQLSGIPGTILPTTTLYVDGLMLYPKKRLNAFSPYYGLPIGSFIKNNVIGIINDDTAVGGDILIVDATSNVITVNLPKARPSFNKKITIKKIDNVNDVTIDANGAETIDGSATVVMDTQWQSLTIVSNGLNWYKI